MLQRDVIRFYEDIFSSNSEPNLQSCDSVVMPTFSEEYNAFLVLCQ